MLATVGIIRARQLSDARRCDLFCFEGYGQDATAAVVSPIGRIPRRRGAAGRADAVLLTEQASVQSLHYNFLHEIRRSGVRDQNVNSSP
jgi:hypothetical protein